MAAIKQLAGQTLWYGLSNVGARLLSSIQFPILTYLMKSRVDQAQFGDMTLIYAWIALANIIFTYGFETAYFRFSNKEGNRQRNIFETAFGSIVISTFSLGLVMFLFRNSLARFFDIGDHVNYVIWCIWIIGLDALAAIPFARLRQEGKPRKYAFIKVGGIVINLVSMIILIVFLPKWVSVHPGNFFSRWYLDQSKMGFVIYANLLQNIFVFLALYREWGAFRFKIDKALWRKMFQYSAPMLIVGLAGMVNEVMDRQLLKWRLPVNPAFGNRDDVMRIVAIYSGCYKLSIFITLFIQAFKMAAEPFFFGQAKEKNAPVTYARVMKWFVIILCIAFLFTTLYMDLLQFWVSRPYRSGLGIVPILVAANVFLGVYYNLSVWYKLTDRMQWGMYITLLGAAITLTGNYFFIPMYGMYAGAWSTCICYFTMMVITYLAGHKYFPVPYPVKKLTSYFVVVLILFFVQKIITAYTGSLAGGTQIVLHTITGTILMGLFLLLVLRVERKELSSMPVIGKFLK